MKTFKSNRKNTGVASAASKACAWILSIMLVVTGMAPSFAANNKTGKDGSGKAAVERAEKNGKNASEKVSKKTSSTLQNKSKKDKKATSPKTKAKSLKAAGEKEDKNGKRNKIKNKRYKTFKLNESGNVEAWVIDHQENRISIRVDDSSGDLNIERQKWGEMVEAFGGSYNVNHTGRIDWSQASGFGKIDIGSYEIYLPKDSSTFFYGLKKNEIGGLENLKTDNVENMESMFSKSHIMAADFSKWKFNATLSNNIDKTKNMFAQCNNLESIKTYAGLKMNIAGLNSDFKIVKLKKGTQATVEKESQNLNSGYIINSSGDKENIYHIYRKDRCAGVTFDKNMGESEAWVNHAIVEKGKGVAFSMPDENPAGEGLRFKGWSKNKNSTEADFYVHEEIYNDLTLYAVYVEGFPLNSSKNVIAKLDNKGNLTVSAKDTSGDMNIEEYRWQNMAEELDAYYWVVIGSDPEHEERYYEKDWSHSNVNLNSIYFKTKGMHLPRECNGLLKGFPGQINGCENLDTSGVSDMSDMFCGARAANPNVTNWDVSSVRNMSNTFQWASSASPNVTNWNVSYVRNMSSMFDGAESANPDVSKWSTSSVTDVSRMFREVKSANPDVSKWDTSRVTDMDSMFEGATSATPDVSKWSTSSVTDVSRMFREATSANPDVSKWDTSRVTDMNSMFEGATSATPDVSKWNTSNVERIYYIFKGAILAKPDVSNWNLQKVTSMEGMFDGATSANPNVANWDVSKIRYFNDMFKGATSANPDVSKWNVSSVTDMRGMFFGATSANPNVANWDVSKVDNMQSMFKNSGIKKFDLSKWNLSEAALEYNDAMKDMFTECSKLEYLKTSASMHTNISTLNDGSFGIVRARKGDAAVIEEGNKNLKDSYAINRNKDKNVFYHIYRKDKYAGVAFDKNGGNGEAWMNHEIVEKGKSIKESNGSMPAEKPTFSGDEFLGWTMEKDVAVSNFDENTKINKDTTVYALWKKQQKVNITFENNGGAGSMKMQHVYRGSQYELPISKFTPPAGMEFDKWEVTVGGAPAVDKKPGESVTASDNVAVKAMWKTKTVPVMAKVTLHAEGVAGYPQVIEVKRGETLGDKLPAKIEKAGYDFLGYSKDKNGDINFFSDTVVKEDMNVYAVYKSNAPVVKKVENIRLTAGSLRMQLGDLTDILAIVSPSDATDKRVKFTLDREDIIKIVSADDSAARVEAIGEGRVKVKAEALDGSGVTGEITIEVIRKPAKKVQVKLNAEGVAGYPKTLETEEGTSLDANLPMDLKKDGYIFRGWSYDKNGEVNFTKHTQVSKNTEIHAVFKKDEVSALFIAEGAAGFPKSVMVERGKKIGDKLPAAPVRAGYEFEGWSTESSFGTVNVTKDTVIDKDTIVYAVFKKQGAIVKQVSSITLGVTKSNIKAGDEADVIASILPADADDKRLSWESSAPDKLKIEQTGDNFIRIKAEEEGTYTITAKAKDGSNVEASIEIKVVSKISAPISNKVKVMISADGVADYPKLIEIDKNTTLHGKLPADINKPGYKFKGFTKTMGNPADFDDNEVIKEDTRLYAVFEQTAAPTKKVTGIELSKSKSKVAVGDTVDILPSITPEDADNKALDYTVDNKDKALIYKNPDGTLRLYAMLKGKVVVTAKATDGSNVTKSIEIEIVEADKEQVTITLNAEGINGYPKQLKVDKGEALGNALPNVLDKPDYDFRGWSTTPGGMIDVNRLTPMTSSISIYAVFTKKQVNVRMLAEGVNGYPKNVSLDIHSTLGSELPASLNKEGYTFKGWSKDSFTGAVNVTAATKIDESMTIYAVFERQKPVTQKVESIKIEDLSSESKVINKEFNLFANILPESADDKTLEWSVSDPSVKLVQKQNNLVSVTANAPGNYSITAKAKDGSNVTDTFAFTVEVAAPDVRNVKLFATDVAGYPKDIKVTKGENLVGRLPMDLEKDGYTFLGWSKTQGAAEADFDASLPVTDDITLYAVFKKNVTPPAPGKTRVTLDGNGGVLAGGAQANIDIESGDTIKTQLESAVANKIFTKQGYKFIGFSRSKFATAADYNLESPVYTDMTLYAVYEEAPVFTDVTIKYDIFDMENVVIENVAEGKPIGSKLDGHVKQRDGFRFLGFAKTQDATKPDFFRKSIVTNGLVLYPVYKEIGTVDKVKVAFKLNDGTDASIKSEEVIRYESLGDKMPTKDSVPERDGYLFTGWAKSKAAKYPDFFRGTTVKGDMTVYAIWKSLYDERLGQAVLKVAAKAKGYELTIEPPKANLHTGFDIFRSEKKDFKPSKDNKIATVDRNTLKYQDDKADNAKAYYYAVRAIDEDGSYNGTKVTFIGKLSDKVLAAPLPKDKGVTATVAGKGAVSLEFNKTIAAAKYKVTVTAPYDKKFKTIERFVEAGKLAAAGGNKVKANVTGLPMGKFLAFKLEALEADNTKLVEYGNSFAFMMGAVEKLTAKVNKKSRVLNVKFKAMKGVNGYEAKIVIGGKVKTVKLKKGKKKLRGFIVGSIKLPKKKGNYTFTIRAFKKIGKLKYFGQTITKVVR